MELILFIYMLVAIVVTGHIILVREKDVDAVTPAAVAELLTREKNIDGDDIARLVEWAESGGHMPAAHAPAHAVAPVADAAADLLPSEEEDKWENLAEDWEFPVIGKKQSPVMMTGNCRCNRALRGCGRHGKGKQKGGKHIDKKKFRRADTQAHLSLLEELI